MLWVISCVDKPNTAAIREEHLKTHREHLTNSKKILVLAGATQNDEGTEAIAVEQDRKHLVCPPFGTRCDLTAIRKN